MSDPPPSLRDLYSTPSSPWIFTAPPDNTTRPLRAPAQSSSPSYVFPAPRPAQNSIFELSPGLIEPGSVDLTVLVKTLVASAVLQYATTAIAMPWEVGKCLLQVQWIPRNAGEDLGEPPEEVIEVEELSDDSGEDAYFADPTSVSGPSRYPAPRPADQDGYIARINFTDEDTRPEYLMKPGSADGVFGTIKQVIRFRSEGWFALWKGLLTSCISDVLSSTLQPLIHSALLSMFKPTTVFTASYIFPPYAGALAIPVASHLITGFLLSPLDLVRTRLIVQSSSDRYRTYRGPLDALRRIYRDEGGLAGMYLHPHLFFPAVIDNTLRPLLALGLPPLIAAKLFPSALSPETNPLAWGVVEILSASVGFLVSLPLETIRRRLQVQTRGNAEPLRACVEIRPVPYNGIVDALWHILTEERSDLPLRPRRKRKANAKGKGRESEADAEEEEEDVPESRWRHTGLGQLYRGLGTRLIASVMVFVVGMTMGDGDADSGWAEL